MIENVLETRKTAHCLGGQAVSRITQGQGMPLFMLL
jgi:hypothetical protein